AEPKVMPWGQTVAYLRGFGGILIGLVTPMVLEILEERFGAPPAELTAAVLACKDFARHRQWLGLAARAISLERARADAGLGGRGAANNAVGAAWREQAAGPAEPAAPADGAGITAFRGMKLLQPAPLLNFIVRRRRRSDETTDSPCQCGCPGRHNLRVGREPIKQSPAWPRRTTDRPTTAIRTQKTTTAGRSRRPAPGRSGSKIWNDSFTARAYGQ